MKIALFTPVSNNSSIGKCSKILNDKLNALGHDCIIINSEYYEDVQAPVANFDFGSQIIHWEDQQKIELALEEVESIVYQIGDNYQFHAGCSQWIRKQPGIVIMHDFFLASLFYVATAFSKANVHSSIILNNWYGKVIEKSFFQDMRKAENYQDIMKNAPMSEWIAAQATAVITHSQWGVERVRQACSGPVIAVPLANNFDDSNQVIFNFTNNKHFNILTFGHMNANKRMHSVIDAISLHRSLRKKITYILAGFITPEMKQELISLAKQKQVQLEILGEVDDAQLQSLINQVDLVCCLRYPALEAASASTIESMHYGKATLVTNTGFYQELPDDCVYKISIENEINDINKALKYFLRNPKRRITYGQNAQQYAKKTFCIDNYAKTLIEVCEQTRKMNPIVVACNRIVDRLISWGCEHSSSVIIETTQSLKIFEEAVSSYRPEVMLTK